MYDDDVFVFGCGESYFSCVKNSLRNLLRKWSFLKKLKIQMKRAN